MRSPHERELKGVLMHTAYKAGLSAAILIASTSVSAQVAWATTTSFTSPGSSSYAVPSGVTSLCIVATGAGGGGGGNATPGALGGHGAQVTATIPVTPGDTLTINVGSGGGAGTNTGGGGAGGGGGGLTSVYNGATAQIIAGGGGGGGGWSNSGGGNGAAAGTAAGGDGDILTGFPDSAGKGGAGGVGGAGGTSGVGNPQTNGNPGGAVNGGDGQNPGLGAGSTGGTGSTGGSNQGGAGTAGGGAGYGGGGGGSWIGGNNSGAGAGGSYSVGIATYAPGSNGGLAHAAGGDGSVVIDTSCSGGGGGGGGGTGGRASASAVTAAPTATLSLAAASAGAVCAGANPSAVSGTWLILPSAAQCRPSDSSTRPSAQLLGWATSARFPVDRAQAQVDKGWGVIDEEIGGVRMIFIPAGRAAFVSGSNTLYPIWS